MLNMIAPHSCFGCGNIGSTLCQQCKYDIVSEPFVGCLGCGLLTAHDNICAPCKKLWRVDGGWCVGSREGVLRALLDSYKFYSAKQVGAVVAELLHERVPLLPPETVVVAVPTVRAHVRVRGFDHMALIARGFAKRRALPFAAPLRRTGGATQHLKSRTDRLRTAATGLELVGPSPASVLLVDDILTTGATLRACARVLREHGGKDIYVAVVARQPPEGQ